MTTVQHLVSVSACQSRVTLPPVRIAVNPLRGPHSCESPDLRRGQMAQPCVSGLADDHYLTYEVSVSDLQRPSAVNEDVSLNLHT